MPYQQNIPVDHIRQDMFKRKRSNRIKPTEEFVSVSYIRKFVAIIFAGIILAQILVLLLLYKMLSSTDITYSAPPKAKSELTKQEIKSLNIVKPISEKYRSR